MPLYPPELKCVILNATHRKHIKLHGDVTDSDTFPALSHKVKVLNLLLSLSRHTKKTGSLIVYPNTVKIQLKSTSHLLRPLREAVFQAQVQMGAH